MKVCPLLKRPCIGKKCVNCEENPYYYGDNFWVSNENYLSITLPKGRISELYCKHFKTIIREGKK